MQKLLQVDFDFTGPFGADMTAAMGDLARSINDEPGMIWKIWTEDKSTGKAGGIYLFESEETAKSYLVMHSARLEAMGIQGIRGIIFEVNAELSAINSAPL
ncbi:monooxygenase [Pelagivirga sediminicola]|uniref:Monooxygenase n=1 Tax=Pelagivirga sediminicola TaxID=2170575 RepID=A0A2T7G4H6_9RHOB|nr:monooxygenase [Pelagivirga sediminicola]PVA09324.1 monooxygenase [Pelagivirga sediminicola]